MVFFLRYLKPGKKNFFRMAASEKERINKLECRAKEAENALQQLRAYVELLKKKSMDSSSSAETTRIEAENAQLRKELSLIRQQLILEEIRNGVVQYALPAELPPKRNLTTTTAAAPPSSVPASSTSATSEPSMTEPPPQPAPTQPAREPKEGKKENGEKSKKKEGKTGEGGGGAGGKGGDKPVDVSRLDMRIGKILKAWKHPDADGLYVEEVDVGEPGRIRTVCSGLVQFVQLNDMQERMAVFLCNLKPAKMRGVSSEAMVMCASSPENVEILDPPTGCVVGERVVCPGYDGEPDAVLNPKKKIFEAVQPDLRTNDEGVACYKDVPFTILGKGVCRSQTMKGTGIK